MLKCMNCNREHNTIITENDKKVNSNYCIDCVIEFKEKEEK